MNKECNKEEGLKNSKPSRLKQSLSVPDPCEIFAVNSLYRAPSVPNFARRMSSEPNIKYNEDKLGQLPQSAFKKYRRKSIPDRLDKKISQKSKKSESKIRLVSKNSEFKPLLNKSGKIVTVKTNKVLKKPSFCIPHSKKPKKTGSKASLIPLEANSQSPERHKPTVFLHAKTKKTSKKDFDEGKKVLIDKKDLKPDEENCKILKIEKFSRPGEKACKSALSLRTDEKKSKKIKDFKEKNFVNKTDETPPKRKISKKKAITEKSTSHSIMFKGKPAKEELLQKNLKPARKFSRDSEKKQKIENKFLGKPEVAVKRSADLKKIKFKAKRKSVKKTNPDPWLDHSFFKNSKKPENHDDSLFLEDFSKENNLNNEFLCAKVFSQNSNYKEEKLANHRLSVVESEKIHEKNLEKAEIKEIKNKIRNKINKFERKTKAITKIQALVRGFLCRKKLYKGFIFENISRLEQSNSRIYKNDEYEEF